MMTTDRNRQYEEGATLQHENMTTGIYLPRSLKSALEFEAERDGRSVSGLIRLACGRYLADVAIPERRERPLTRTLDASAQQTAHESLSSGDA
jgi:hypothetical protein